ncbi:MAG: hypothetical protein INQ03_24890 [Candidatus Heimdallarchaeota archaeon]|nr:hypothetical protein [Candidatus Heimdallarchaeota archaeon]
MNIIQKVLILFVAAIAIANIFGAFDGSFGQNVLIIGLILVASILIIQFYPVVLRKLNGENKKSPKQYRYKLCPNPECNTNISIGTPTCHNCDTVVPEDHFLIK